LGKGITKAGPNSAHLIVPALKMGLPKYKFFKKFETLPRLPK